MARQPRITRLTVHEYAYPLDDMGYDYNGFNLVYQPGNHLDLRGYVFTVETDAGVTGEYAGGNAVSYAQVGMVAHYLLGKNPLERERIYNDVKRALRKHDRFGLGPIDIALWDIAGKLYDAPVYELLGGYRTALPAYASTYHGDENGGLSSPDAFAAFAVQCRDLGYRAYKIHGWGHGPIAREAATVLAVREAVGPGMDLMLDPACEYETFADALKVGRACDEAGFFWYEDPFKDGGLSAFAHRKLRQLIKTPLLLGEHVRGMELHVDQIVGEGTDYVRADADYDGGITGVLKLAHAAEGFGLDCEIHAPGPAHRHCMAALRNSNYYELGLVHPNAGSTGHTHLLYRDGYSDALDAIDADGCVPVPQGPGLGVALDWDSIRAHETGKVVYE
ncbi:MAG TPA: enolase C-terminal domain-like protein [Thermomicrobiales bacterium]|nr:enolase C-terminal domain-like protein [Thermomicrobiales bacterium]